MIRNLKKRCKRRSFMVYSSPWLTARPNLLITNLTCKLIKIRLKPQSRDDRSWLGKPLRGVETKWLAIARGSLLTRR